MQLSPMATIEAKESVSPLAWDVHGMKKPEIWLAALRLQCFRNYQSLQLELSDQHIVLCGENGVGKTNILEAISLLAPGRGLRRAKTNLLLYKPPYASFYKEAMDDEILSDSWSVSAEVMTEDGMLKVGTGKSESEQGENGRRIVKVNGAFSSQMALAEHFAVSWLTPEMDGVLAASPSERRRFLDRLVIAFDPAHAGRLQRFEKLYRQRNRLLEDGAGDKGWFEALEAQMAESGVAIIAARQSLIFALNAEIKTQRSLFPAAQLTLEGDVETWLETMPAIDVEDRIKKEAKVNRLAGNTNMPSPMMSLWHVTHSGTGQTAMMSSTGEQKALVISVVLAHARLQDTRLQLSPILLLDDIASHLDQQHRKALFELTEGLRGQVWFSGTDADIFDEISGRAKVIHIKGGQIARRAS